MARRNPNSKPTGKPRSRDERSVTGAQPDFRPGGLVHPIQARKFLEDGNSWVRADATVVGDSTFRVVFEDRTEKRFRCAHAHTARGVIEAHATDVEGYPVFVSARWGVLAVPVGEAEGRLLGVPRSTRASVSYRTAVSWRRPSWTEANCCCSASRRRMRGRSGGAMAAARGYAYIGRRSRRRSQPRVMR